MKRAASFAVLALLSLSLSLFVATGCGKKGPPKPPVEQKGSVESQQAQ